MRASDMNLILILYLETYSYFLALGTVFLQVVIAYLVFEYFFLREKYLSPYIERFALEIICVVGLASVVFSFVYSEVFGLIPCALCWIQRGLLYAIVIISGTALWKKYWGVHRDVRGDVYKDMHERAVTDYGIVLSSIAGVIALYGHYLQMGGSALVTCPTAGAGAECAQRLVFEFGYITIPLMSLTTFVFFIVVFCMYRRGNTHME